eukprot:m.5428 g.5428  ORF g.5428 m.5428 type:complete len:163 (+) comp7660_c0_seq1:1068-1556(+)
MMLCLNGHPASKSDKPSVNRFLLLRPPVREVTQCATVQHKSSNASSTCARERSALLYLTGYCYHHLIQRVDPHRHRLDLTFHQFDDEWVRHSSSLLPIGNAVNLETTKIYGVPVIVEDELPSQLPLLSFRALSIRVACFTCLTPQDNNFERWHCSSALCHVP